MSNAFKRYLFILNILLISGLASLHANPNINYSHIIPEVSTSEVAKRSTQNQQHKYFSLSEIINKNSVFIELFDNENFEDDEEEENTKPSLLTFSKSPTSLFYTLSTDEISCKLKIIIQTYIYNSSKTLIPLHSKFQVFII